MTNAEFENWMLEQGFPEYIQNFIRLNRNAPPARKVRSSGRNVIANYTSVKNGETISCESDLELACAMTLDSNRNVLEFRSQRPVYTANYINKNGKRAGHQKICDFFIILRDGIEMKECKYEKDLAKISKENPDLFKKAQDGTWRCPAGEEYAKEYGCQFTVFSETDISWQFRENAKFLFDYFVDDPLEVPLEVAERIMVIVRAEMGITYHVLTNEHQIDPDHLNMLIATRRLYVDLAKELLVDTREVHLYADEESARSHVVRPRAISPHLQDLHSINIEVGERIKWGQTEWTIMDFDNTRITLYAENGHVVKPLMSVIIEAVRRGEIIGLSKYVQKSNDENKLNDFFRTASKKDLKLFNQRMMLMDKIPSLKGG